MRMRKSSKLDSVQFRTQLCYDALTKHQLQYCTPALSRHPIPGPILAILIVHGSGVMLALGHAHVDVKTDV